jgi:hypothetical protein
MTMAFRNGKLEDLCFSTEKGADVSVRDNKNNGTVHFAAVTYSVDVIKLLLGKRTSVNMMKIRSIFQLNLVVWKQGKFFFLKSCTFEQS